MATASLSHAFSRDWFSTTCVNGCAMLIGHKFPSSTEPLALLSAWVADIVYSNGDRDSLWRLTERTEYWTKPVWVLPVISNNHWLLATFRLSSRTITVFDSFGSTETCSKVASLAYRLVLQLAELALAKKNVDIPQYGWCGYPASLDCQQKNGYDCGVWVVACIFSICQGHTTVVASETEIESFRLWLFLHAFILPKN
ncbi:hypothetical protein C8Q78DRAFT_1070870 [Trametes maxima]|nr:hypothetical protein C8Q78DRAFT_1070870 [Trametes maxima]